MAGKMGKRVLAVVLALVLATGICVCGAVGAGAAFSTTPMTTSFLVLRADGTVWGMAELLGDNIAYAKLDGLSNITAIAIGGENHLALKSDGSVWKITATFIESNDSYKYAIAQVAGLSDVTAIAASYYACAAVKGDGTVWIWGNPTMLYNTSTGMGIASTTPIQAPGLNGIVSIDLGMDHGVALKNDGTVWTWGRNDDKQLGRPLQPGWYADNPGMIPGLNGVKAVAGGREHTLVLKNDGTVWGFGSNYEGQLGDGTFNDAASPVQAQGLSDVRSIALTVNSGARYSIAVKNDNTLWAWGDVRGYDIGVAGYSYTNVPKKVLNINDVAFADGLMSAIKTDGTCWIVDTPLMKMVYSDGTPLNVYDGLPPTPVTYTVTVANGTGGGEFEAGTPVTIVAGTAPSGQQFKQWSITPTVTFTGGTSAASATATFTMPAQAVTATAVYEDIPDSGTPGPGQTTNTNTAPPKGILGTNARYNQWWHYILFFLCFGFIWMWF